MKHSLFYIGAALLTLLPALAACSDDDAPLPPLRQELCELLTDAAGSGATLLPDGGEPLAVTAPATGLRPDTAYRVLCLYTPDTLNRRAEIAQTVAVASTKARELPDSLLQAARPVGVEAVWRSPRYVNFRLRLPASLLKPALAFHLAACGANGGGGQTDVVRLVILASDTARLLYSSQAFASLPLWSLPRSTQPAADSVRVEALTPSGMVRRTFRLQADN